MENNLELENILIRVAQEEEYEIFQHITKETIETLYVPYDQEQPFDYVDFPEGTQYVDGDDDDEDKGFYRHVQVNELGYIPVRPIYQSTKIQNGVGHTPIFDIAQIQRSVYADMGEIYSAVS